MKKQRASSLILVLVVIASIMTITLGTQRVSLVQFAQSNREEDSLYALYAAKGAIEQGLNVYRNYRDAETLPDNVFRFDLTAGLADNHFPAQGYEVPATDSIQKFTGVGGIKYDPTHQHYDLNINFKSTQAGSFGSPPTIPPMSDSKITIDKDNFLELTGFRAVTPNDSWYLRYGFKFYNPAPPKYTNSCSTVNPPVAPLVQIQTINENGDLKNITVTPVTGMSYDSADQLTNLLMNTDVSKLKLLSILPLYCDVKAAFMSTTGLGTRVAGPVLFDGLINDDGKFITRLTATGYFGEAKRTLVGEIDRKSNQLIGVYNLNAYAGGSIQRQ